MRPTLFGLALLGCADPVTGAPTDPFTEDPTTQMSPAYDDISELFEDALATSGAPAITGAIVDGEDLLALGAVGARRTDRAVPVTLDDRWHLGSCTKAMTATLVATFVEDGDLTFETPVSDLFPDILGDPAWDDVTMADLLGHTAGVGDISAPTWAEWWNPGDSVERRADYAMEVLTAPPNAAQGTFTYSNGGFILAGAALERLTGESWETLMEDRLFAPLGMTACGFGPPGTGNPAGHDAGGTPQPDGDNPPTLGPAGTVHCSMQSWAKFVSANVSGPRGEAPILEAATWQRLHDAPVDGYALGWGVTQAPWAGGTAVTHVGSNTFWYAVAWVTPQIDRGYLAITNSGHPDHYLSAADAAIGAMIRLGSDED